jgi:hypothetical protein
MTSRPMLILIAGPYKSGTGGDPDAMAANLRRLEDVLYPTAQRLLQHCDAVLPSGGVR